MSDLKRCYEILEIEPGSTYEEAKQAFRDMVSIWHPDKFSNNSRLKEKAEEKLKLINAAWQELQAFFSQKEDATVEQPRRELAEPAKVCSARDRNHRQCGGRAVRADCSFVDIDFEPVIPLEQARKAYRHRFQSGLHDPGATRGMDTDSDGIAPENGVPKESPGTGEKHEKAGQQGIGGLHYDRAEGDAARRQPDEQVAGEKKAGAGKRHDKGDKDPARGKKDAQQPPDDGFNERDRKIKLLSDSYWLGFLERKFVNWQQREREHRKQQDAAKDIARKNKILADIYLTRYKTWLAREKSKYKSFPKISNLLKINTSSVGGSSTRKFLFGVPDVTLTFVKGGSFLMGHDPGNIFHKMPVRSGDQPYRVVTVDDFYIGKYPVTVRQWSKAMGVEAEGDEQDFPVLLTWDGVREFIFRLNDITGLKFRVPTEAEWEYAARSGGKEEDLIEIADGSAIHDPASPARYKVGQCKPNGLGIFDILGNNGEWVTGSPPKQTRRIGPQVTPIVTGNSVRQVIRGIIHRDLHRNFTFSYTFHRNFPPADKVHRYGFRLAHPAF